MLVMKTAIHWFRRDLRVSDNTALREATSRSESLVPVYICSTWSESHRWTGAPRQEFLCGCLASLQANLEAIGGRLIIRHGDAVEELLRLAKQSGAETIFFNRDPDPFGRTVETRLAEAAEQAGIALVGCQDIAIHERDSVLTGSGGPFRVFTPYSRAWQKLPKPGFHGKIKHLQSPTDLPSDPLPTLATWGLRADASIIEPGEKAARRRLQEFLQNGLTRYAERRNTPAGQTTSRLSQDLRFGLLSIREVYAKCREAAETLPAAERASANTYINELIWREFYFQILWHYPEVLEQEFNPTLRHLPWPGASSNLARWQEGTTGFPIVDAAMRQLAQSGFMHNRTRMITAMFLTKDLHLDWRLGESWFMQRLVDGEIASNNGGWQWSAGTGADAAPYFRIQNPWTQSLRFDPNGEYIKTWLPELKDIPPARLHQPPATGSLARGYPAPMLDHAEARHTTLDFFAKHKAANPSA